MERKLLLAFISKALRDRFPDLKELGFDSKEAILFVLDLIKEACGLLAEQVRAYEKE